jgi:hypothetical protein
MVGVIAGADQRAAPVPVANEVKILGASGWPIEVEAVSLRAPVHSLAVVSR